MQTVMFVRALKIGTAITRGYKVNRLMAKLSDLLEKKKKTVLLFPEILELQVSPKPTVGTQMRVATVFESFKLKFHNNENLLLIFAYLRFIDIRCVTVISVKFVFRTETKNVWEPLIYRPRPNVAGSL